MARQLTKKQRKYVNAKVSGKTGVAAALESYDTTDYEVANAISVENLQKPSIQTELTKLGFDENNAKQVIGDILDNTEERSENRIKAAQEVFKVKGTYAPEKSTALNLNIGAQNGAEELKTLALRVREQMKKEYEAEESTQERI